MRGELDRDGTRLVYEGSGRVDGTSEAAPSRPGARMPFVFQHGMGGSTAQALGYPGAEPPGGVVCLAARGHAPSGDLTPEAASFDVFADDVVALADRLGLARFPVGGISLGAGTAMSLVTRHPERVSALVLCRPAWLDEPLPEFNRDAYDEIAGLLDELREASEDPGPEEVERTAARYRERSAIYREVLGTAPAAAASLVGQITRPRAAQNAVLLRALPADRPTASRTLWSSVDVPTLVVGHHGDRFHPHAVAGAYAEQIPGAALVTVPSKDADAAGFTRQIATALDRFLSSV